MITFELDPSDEHNPRPAEEQAEIDQAIGQAIREFDFFAGDFVLETITPDDDDPAIDSEI